MAETRLTRTRSVLPLVFDEGPVDSATFARETDCCAGEYDRVVSLAWIDWAELGEPDVVTVTIRPGDLLTEEADDDARLEALCTEADGWLEDSRLAEGRSFVEGIVGELAAAVRHLMASR